MLADTRHRPMRILPRAVRRRGSSTRIADLAPDGIARQGRR